MRFNFGILLLFFLLLSSLHVNAVDNFISDELGSPLYNITVITTPTTNKSTLQLAIESGIKKNEITLTLHKKLMTINLQHNGKDTECGKFNMDYQQDKPLQFTIMRRNEWLGISQNDEIIWHNNLPHLDGVNTEWRKTSGWTDISTRVQRLEPVIFSDDFMREVDDNGQWIINKGNWKLQSAWDKDPKGGSKRFINQVFAQNPFSCVGHAVTGSALCTTGMPYWDNYTASIAVQTPRDGAVGLSVNMTDADNGILARWTPVTDKSERGNRISLIAIKNGKETVLTENKGGYLPGQWYRLAVISTFSGVRVLVDGQERLTKDAVSPWHGGVGLYAEGDAGTTFDDVTVYGQTVNNEKINIMNEHRVARIANRIRADHKGMAVWAASGNDWQPMQTDPQYLAHRYDYYGAHWITLNTRYRKNTTGQLALILNSDGINANSGYRAIFKPEGEFGSISLYRDEQLLKQTKLSQWINEYDSYSVRFYHTGNTVKLEIDDDNVLEAVDPKPLPGLRPAYSATGCFTVDDDIMVVGQNMYDESFADAPTDWMTEGTWMPTTRWSCSNQWSFLGGWSRGDAIIWHKKQFYGNQFIDAYLGVKMEYPREHQNYDNRYRDLAVTICGNGKNPRTGYSGIVNATDNDGKPSLRTILLRNGIEVSNTILKLPTAGNGGHTHWFRLELQKKGSVIEFWVDGEKALTYNDTEPITGGIPAVWTTDNGISLARVRISSSSPAIPRTDQQVTIDEPWYPSWGNVNYPLNLNFTGIASTADAPIHLQIKKRMAPDKTTDPVINNTQLTITPAVAGDYWYQVTATDGKISSPAFNLSMPVFTPSLGRNDADAVVLYRYDEGNGKIIHDYSTVGNAANLTINNTDATTWVPGQGLTIHGPGQIMSKAVPKLMEIAKKKACTIECWVEIDTIYSPAYWLGAFLAWELPQEKRNFALAQISRDLVFSPCGTTFNPLERKSPHLNYIRTGLQHIVITWDGTTTRAYVNGILMGQSNVGWQTDKWSPDAPLIVGSLAIGQPDYADNIAKSIGVALYIIPHQGEMQNAFMGSLYLTAIHQRCLSPEDVKRHYMAGPSAK